ncbi:AAA family ATPase [Taurinivorans muris]|uniref:AAA family ATPase n=1 Tax=Taurinivorans muris TaxID=2787751 RepID=A0ABY5Y3W5_9BACT|nr:AAA family ATPase [Desulfovibrionaceae bacterium LT0009]
MAKIISFFNHKGGVGKTTNVHNIACALRELGKKILVVDADPQMNLTARIAGFSMESEYKDEDGTEWREFNAQYTSLDEVIYSVIRGEKTPINFYLQEFESKKNGSINLIASSFRLAELETDLVDIIKRNNTFDKGRIYNIEKFFREQLIDYDFILIDFSPSASSIINGILMMMSDYFIVPTFPTLFSLQAVENLENVIKNWSSVLENQKQTATEHGLSFKPKFLGLIISAVKRRTTKGITAPTGTTDKWIELVNTRIKDFYSYAYNVDRAISEEKFRKIFPQYEPFILGISYDFTLPIRTNAEDLGKSEFDLIPKELPKTVPSKREDEHGNPIKVDQYKESHKLIKETYSYIAKCLIKL